MTSVTATAAPSAAAEVTGPSMRTLSVRPTATSGTQFLKVRARADLAAAAGPQVTVRIDGVAVGNFEVRSASMSDYYVDASLLRSGSTVDIVFTNDGVVNGQDRNLYVGYVESTGTVVLPTAAGVYYDRGNGSAAFDGVDRLQGQSEMFWGGALRMPWPSSVAAAESVFATRQDAARLLMQGSFGPTLSEINRVAGIGASRWVDEQLALPATANYLNAIQAKYSLGDNYRPGGPNYDPGWVAQQFWASAHNAPDQLRRRMGFALHHIFMVSQADTNLFHHSRAYANYLDTLNRHAFGNFRVLLEDMALSPVMGVYLSHMRNRKEDPATGRLPDENFAREVMQLFTIGLYELNPDGTLKRDANGLPIETYTNADVMAMAKVFTGWSWGFPDNQLTETNFRSGNPGYTVATDTQVDLQRMKAYPGQGSTAEVQLFAGKPSAVTLPSYLSAGDRLRVALDALFHHPNTAPFISRQLIQRLVTSQPSPQYVGRVAAVFANNGRGTRGDLAAVVRAILLDSEARSATAPEEFGKLREPTLRVAHWMRAFKATSTSGNYALATSFATIGQRPLYAGSVFGYFRPGYVPPQTSFSSRNAAAPEFQAINESTTAAWINCVESMTTSGIGCYGTTPDVVASYADEAAYFSAGRVGAFTDDMNLVLFAGRMSPFLRQAMLDTIAGVSGSTSNSFLYRARSATFLALASPEFAVQH